MRDAGFLVDLAHRLEPVPAIELGCVDLGGEQHLPVAPCAGGLDEATEVTLSFASA